MTSGAGSALGPSLWGPPVSAVSQTSRLQGGGWERRRRAESMIWLWGELGSRNRSGEPSPFLPARVSVFVVPGGVRVVAGDWEGLGLPGPRWVICLIPGFSIRRPGRLHLSATFSQISFLSHRGDIRSPRLPTPLSSPLVRTWQGRGDVDRDPSSPDPTPPRGAQGGRGSVTTAEAAPGGALVPSQSHSGWRHHFGG